MATATNLFCKSEEIAMSKYRQLKDTRAKAIARNSKLKENAKQYCNSFLKAFQSHFEMESNEALFVPPNHQGSGTVKTIVPSEMPVGINAEQQAESWLRFDVDETTVSTRFVFSRDPLSADGFSVSVGTDCHCDEAAIFDYIFNTVTQRFDSLQIPATIEL